MQKRSKGYTHGVSLWDWQGTDQKLASLLEVAMLALAGARH